MYLHEAVYMFLPCTDATGSDDTYDDPSAPWPDAHLLDGVIQITENPTYATVTDDYYDFVQA